MTKPNAAEVADPSPPLFPADARFSSADDFFAEATRRLVHDWGYVVERSTEKSNKVTGRCERFDQGCPFRLCAILPEGKSTWRINTSSCVWDHSHPARSSSGRFKPRPGSSADDSATINSTSQSAEPSVAAVLFAVGTRFATSEGFFRQVDETSKRLSGIGCSRHFESVSLLVARCTPRHHTRCPYKVHAIPAASGGGWILDTTASNWVHNHVSSNQRPSQKHDTTDQTKRDQAPKAAFLAPQPPKLPKATFKGAHLGPQIGDRFHNFNEVFLAAASTSIVTLGNSVIRTASSDLAGGIYCHYGRATKERCHYKLNVGRTADGKGCVVLPASHPVHSHGPCPELQADPSWRPHIRDRNLIRAIEALGTAGTAKRRRAPSPIVEITSVSPKSKRQRLSPALRTDSSTIPSPSGLLAASTVYPSPALSASPLPSTQLGTPRLPNDPAAGAPLEDRLALVEAFVAGVNPAEVASARHLVAAGVDSHEALVNLVSLGPALRKTFLDELARRNAIELGVLGSAFPAS